MSLASKARTCPRTPNLGRLLGCLVPLLFNFNLNFEVEYSVTR